MGWQDAPVVNTPPSGGDQPAWMKAPVVGAPSARPDATVGNTLGGAAELIGGGIANIPHAALHAGVDLARRLTGGNTDAPDPALVQMTEVPTGDAARNLIGRVADSSVGQGVGTVVKNADRALGDFSPVAQDLVHGAGSVAGDVLNLLPAAGAAKSVSGAIDRSLMAPGAAAAVNPATRATAAGYKFLPSSAKSVEPSMDLPLGASTAEKLSSSPNILPGVQKGNSVNAMKALSADIGAPAGTTRFSQTLFNNLKQPHSAVYTEVGDALPQFQSSPQLGAELQQISTKLGLDPKTKQSIAAQVEQYNQPDWKGPDAVETIKVLRSKAANQMSGPDEATKDLGFANRQTANALESELERQATARGDSALVTRFQAARQALAKINDVQDITVAGQPDIHLLPSIGEKGGAKLTGALADAAHVAEHFPQETMHPQKVAQAAASFPAVPDTGAGWVRKGVAGLAGRFATSEGSQAAIGRAMSSDPLPNRVLAAPSVAPSAIPGQFTGAARDQAQFLAGDLGLAPDSAPSPLPPTQASSQVAASPLVRDLELAGQSAPTDLPAATGRPTDLTLAPDHAPGGVPFTPPNGTGQAPTLASELSLAPDHQGGSLPGGQAPNASQLAGDLGLKENARVQPKIPAKAASLAGDLGITDFRDQRPLQNPGKRTPPVRDNTPPGVPAGRSVALSDDLGLNPNQTGKAAALPKANNAKLAIQENVKGDELADEHILPGSTLITHAGEDGATKGFMAYRENADGQLQLSRTSVDPAARGGGIGKAMLVEAAEQAAKAGKPLVSDGSVTVDQLRVYESLKKAGKLDFSYADPKAVKTALASKDGRVTVKGKGGTPVVTDIRPYEGEADGTS